MKPGAGQRKDQAARPAQPPRTPPESAGGGLPHPPPPSSPPFLGGGEVTEAAGQGRGAGERRGFPAASGLPGESIFETQVGPKVRRADGRARTRETPVGRSGSRRIIPPEVSHPGAAGPAQLHSGRRRPLGAGLPALTLQQTSPVPRVWCLSVPRAGLQANLGRSWWAQGTLSLWGVGTCRVWGAQGRLLSSAHDLGWMGRGKGIRRGSGPSMGRGGISERG